MDNVDDTDAVSSSSSLAASLLSGTRASGGAAFGFAFVVAGSNLAGAAGVAFARLERSDSAPPYLGGAFVIGGALEPLANAARAPPYGGGAFLGAAAGDGS